MSIQKYMYLVIRMTKVCFSCIGLCLKLVAHSSQNPWDFQNVKNDEGVFCFVNEATFGNYLRMGTGCQGSQACG